MGLIPQKRWRVSKFSKRTGNLLPTSAPEAARRFWTEGGAFKEVLRLTDIADRKGLPYAYRAQRMYGK